MFGGNPLPLLSWPLIAVLAIMVLDWPRHSWRGWKYYTLAYLVVLAFQLAYMAISLFQSPSIIAERSSV